jgi:hypothetical protein
MSKEPVESIYDESFYEVLEDVHVHGHSLRAGEPVAVTGTHFPNGIPRVELAPLGVPKPIGWVNDRWMGRFLKECRVATGARE